MDRIELATVAADFKGQLATVTYTDGTDLTVVINGNVNSKGLVVRHSAEEPVFYIAPTKIESVDLLTDDLEDYDGADAADDDESEDGGDHTNEEIYAMLEDGMTTADLAAVLSEALATDLTPKELRVHLRALGLGVGKGRKYSLTATEFRMVRDLIKAEVA